MLLLRRTLVLLVHYLAFTIVVNLLNFKLLD